MGTGPKAAVFAAFIRVFIGGFDVPVEGLGMQLHNGWINAVAVIAILTMTVGNIIAISQKNIKRMLAYSSIAHAGYALVGFVTGDFAPVAFYLLAYSVVSVGAFGVIQLLARAGDQKTLIDDGGWRRGNSGRPDPDQVGAKVKTQRDAKNGMG